MCLVMKFNRYPNATNKHSKGPNSGNVDSCCKVVAFHNGIDLHPKTPYLFQYGAMGREGLKPMRNLSHI